MQINRWMHRAGWAAVPAVMLLLAAVAVAKEPAAGRHGGEPAAGSLQPTDSPRSPGDESSLAAPRSDYWLGIECYPVPPVVRAQLNLPEHQGLLVESVVPDSPAAKAGVKPLDILMKVGDKALKDPGELIKAVNASKDKELAVQVLRGGKTLTLKAKPARRPEAEAMMGRVPGALEGDWDMLRKWLDQTRKNLEQEQPGADVPSLRFRFFHPGAILPPGASLTSALPGNVAISVHKKGNEPAKITVTRDNEKWETTETQLDKLPADLRPYVEQMLGRGSIFGGPGRMRMHVAPAPGEPGKPDRSAPRAAAPSDQPGSAMERMEQRMEKQMKQMNSRIERLQKSINEMHERQSGKASPKARDEK